MTAKRLSASKMNELTKFAMGSMEVRALPATAAHALMVLQSDTQMVSMLYRTHKSLPPASKVSSLYVFDALARAARSHAVKHNVTGDVMASAGNSATFLLKMEGVLDGLVRDMMNLSDVPETQVRGRFRVPFPVVARAFYCGHLSSRAGGCSSLATVSIYLDLLSVLQQRVPARVGPLYVRATTACDLL